MFTFNFLQIQAILHYTTFRERKSQNIHLFLQVINTYRGTQNLSKHDSVTEFLNSEPPINSNNLPECNDTKDISYYMFETKSESSRTNGRVTEHSRTARVDKKEKVCEIVKNLLNRGENFLGRPYHLDDIAAVSPMIREIFSGKYTELDFPENLALKQSMKFKMLISLENSILFIVQLLNLVKINTYII